MGDAGGGGGTHDEVIDGVVQQVGVGRVGQWAGWDVVGTHAGGERQFWHHHPGCADPATQTHIWQGVPELRCQSSSISQKQEGYVFVQSDNSGFLEF